MTMGWVAAATVTAAIVGSSISGSAAKSAAQTQADAAGAASQLQYTEFQQQQDALAPWRTAGATALNTLQTGLQPGGAFNKPFTLADFQQSPGYNFQKAQGESAIGAQGAAAGKTFAPATTTALEARNQDLANTSYQQAFSNYNTLQQQQLGATQSLAGVGLSATNATNSAGGTMASNIGSNIIGAGNAQAAGQIGTSNAWSSGLSQGAQSGLNASYMNQILNPTYQTNPSAPGGALNQMGPPAPAVQSTALTDMMAG